MLGVVVLDFDVGVVRHLGVGLTEALPRKRIEGEWRRENRIIGEEIVVIVTRWLIWNLASVIDL